MFNKRMFELDFYSRPCGRGDQSGVRRSSTGGNFYSRPCGRGDVIFAIVCNAIVISTHAPAGGATPWCPRPCCRRQDFYSRPCGRGDPIEYNDFFRDKTFLLTPLREGRQNMADGKIVVTVISTHAPAGGATRTVDTEGTRWL